MKNKNSPEEIRDRGGSKHAEVTTKNGDKGAGEGQRHR